MFGFSDVLPRFTSDDRDPKTARSHVSTDRLARLIEHVRVGGPTHSESGAAPGSRADSWDGTPYGREPPTKRKRALVTPTALRGSRLDPGRQGWIALTVLTAVLTAGIVFVVWINRPAPEPVAPLGLPPARVQAPAPPPKPEPLVISVVGKVAKPGLVRVAPGSRVAHALEAAGGPVEGTDVTSLNLARRLADGEQLHVGIPLPPGASAAGANSVAAAPGGRGPAGSAGGQQRADLNTATANQLEELDGVGPVTAKRIVEWRTANGRFSSVEQLREVDGIGETRFERLRDLVRV